MEFLQVEKCQADADGVHTDPKSVKYVMPERSSNQWAGRWRAVWTVGAGAGRESPGQEGRSEIYGNRCKPYHERSKQDALEQYQFVTSDILYIVQTSWDRFVESQFHTNQKYLIKDQ